MYGTDIQTTLSIRGHVVFIEYSVTPDWAVSWTLNPGSYFLESDPDATTEAALDLLETLLRTHESERIEQHLLSEFEHRQYAQEQAEAALFEQEDIPF